MKLPYSQQSLIDSAGLRVTSDILPGPGGRGVSYHAAVRSLFEKGLVEFWGVGGYVTRLTLAGHMACTQSEDS